MLNDCGVHSGLQGSCTRRLFGAYLTRFPLRKCDQLHTDYSSQTPAWPKVKNTCVPVDCEYFLCASFETAPHKLKCHALLRGVFSADLYVRRNFFVSAENGSNAIRHFLCAPTLKKSTIRKTKKLPEPQLVAPNLYMKMSIMERGHKYTMDFSATFLLFKKNQKT